jgi:prevent-host-death family protein
MITTALSRLKDHLSSYVKKAAEEEVLITNHGKPVAVIKGFASEEEYLEYRLLNDPRFQEIVQRSRSEAREGKVTKLEDLESRRRTISSSRRRGRRG